MVHLDCHGDVSLLGEWLVYGRHVTQLWPMRSKWKSAGWGFKKSITFLKGQRPMKLPLAPFMLLRTWYVEKLSCDNEVICRINPICESRYRCCKNVSSCPSLDFSLCDIFTLIFKPQRFRFLVTWSRSIPMWYSK